MKIKSKMAVYATLAGLLLLLLLLLFTRSAVYRKKCQEPMKIL